MTNYFCVTVTFLDQAPAFHGRGNADEPEWPPSPLRLFQALVAAAAGRWRETQFNDYARPALEWLQRQPPPIMIAPLHHVGVPIRIAVPNNDMDLVASAWSAGREPKKQPSQLKALKTVRRTWLLSKDGNHDAVHYLWPLSLPDPDFERHKEILFDAARSITHLGWGVDMVAAQATVITTDDAAKLPGERWRPTGESRKNGHRVPQEGTLNALIDRHHAFLNRIGPEGFRPVPPLTTFDVVSYCQDVDLPQRPFAAFSLLTPDASGYRSFDTPRRLKAVAGMLRHAVWRAAVQSGWRPNDVPSFILGHGERRGEAHRPVAGPRLAYLPVPSIQPRPGLTVTAIRRALIVQCGGGDTEEFDRLMRLMSGTDLIPETSDEESDLGHVPSAVEWDAPSLKEPDQPLAMLSRLPDREATICRYVDRSATWATVSPVLLPGYDDRKHYRRRLQQPGLGADEQKRLLDKLDARIEGLLRSAITQAGYSEELARHARLEWRGTGFWPGNVLATCYVPPVKLKKFPRLHVRITWRDAGGNPIPLPGPICLGGGRFVGFGLFAATTDQAERPS